MIAGARFDRERMAAAAADELIAATDLADLLVARRCRSARPTASSPGSCARRSSRGRSLAERRRCRALGERRRARCSAAVLVARVEGHRGRDVAARACASSSSAPARCCVPAGRSRRRSTTARCSRSRRDLVGCVVRARRRRRRDRRDRGLPRLRAGLPRLRRADARAREPLFGAARHRLRLPLLRHPRAAQRGLRARRASAPRC